MLSEEVQQAENPPMLGLSIEEDHVQWREEEEEGEEEERCPPCRNKLHIPGCLTLSFPMRHFAGARRQTTRAEISYISPLHKHTHIHNYTSSQTCSHTHTHTHKHTPPTTHAHTHNDTYTHNRTHTQTRQASAYTNPAGGAGARGQLFMSDIRQTPSPGR